MELLTNALAEVLIRDVLPTILAIVLAVLGVQLKRLLSTRLTREQYELVQLFASEAVRFAETLAANGQIRNVGEAKKNAAVLRVLGALNSRGITSVSDSDLDAAVEAAWHKMALFSDLFEEDLEPAPAAPAESK